MRSQRKLLLEQLDRKIKPFEGLKEIPVPTKGWINAVRTTLNMTLHQLGNKLNITKQAVVDMEDREARGSITIKTLKEVGKALDMQFVYCFVPNTGSLEKYVEQKSFEIAKKIILKTHHNMVLENQGNNTEIINEAIEELANDIKREMWKTLWD